MAEEATDQGLLTYKFWMTNIEQAEKAMPIAAWDSADARLLIRQGTDEANRDGDKRPYVNGFRLHYEQLKSFLDQSEPTFKILPTSPFMSDPTTIKQAEADAQYLKYVWQEQHLQQRQSQKLDSALRRNFGATCVVWDVKKWMPSLKYLPVKNVLVDPNCEGLIEDAGWMGFFENINIFELKQQNPDLTKEELNELKKTAGSSLDTETYEKIDNEIEKEMYQTVKVYHIFAKNIDAILDTGKEDLELPTNKDILEELNISTPKKYLRFVKGYRKGALAEEDWPYELDEDEFPISILRFNTLVEDLYGFTDHAQMERIDELCDAILNDIQNDSWWASQRKYASGILGGGLKRTDVEEFLTKEGRSFIADFIDADGNPKIVEIPVGTASPHLVDTYRLMNEERRSASALGELIAQEASGFKDVTAIAARIHDASVHQKVNRRLSGPEGYEATIADDARKILEVAHQKVPRFSVIDVFNPIVGEYELRENVQWKDAMAILRSPKTKLVKLGADAILGPNLAPFWPDTGEFSIAYFKLSTSVNVAAGSTRAITREHRAAIWKQHLLEVYLPLYQAVQRWDLYARFAGRVGEMLGIENIDDYLPKQEEIQQFQNEQKQLQMQEQAQQMASQGGGSVGSGGTNPSPGGTTD